MGFQSLAEDNDSGKLIFLCVTRTHHLETFSLNPHIDPDAISQNRMTFLPVFEFQFLKNVEMSAPVDGGSLAFVKFWRLNAGGISQQ